MAGGLALHLRSVRPMGLRSSGMSCTSSGAALTGAAPAPTGPTWGSAAAPSLLSAPSYADGVAHPSSAREQQTVGRHVKLHACTGRALRCLGCSTI
jgi:hypothetical protein